MKQENNTIFKNKNEAYAVCGSELHNNIECDKLVVQRSNIRKQIAETAMAQKRECELRDKMRERICNFESNLTKFSFNSQRYIIEAGYPFVTKEEKLKLLSLLEEIKREANSDYYAQIKELDKMRERLNLHIQNIKVLNGNLDLLKKYFSKVNSIINELDK